MKGSTMRLMIVTKNDEGAEVLTEVLPRQNFTTFDEFRHHIRNTHDSAHTSYKPGSYYTVDQPRRKIRMKESKQMMMEIVDTIPAKATAKKGATE